MKGVPPFDSTDLACIDGIFHRHGRLAYVWLDRATIRFRFIGHYRTYIGSFCVFGPALSSPTHASISLAMRQIEIEIVFVLCGGLKLTSGHRISTVFNGQNHFTKIAGSTVLDEYYNTYPRK
jgi:hypothetical protein